MKNQIEGIDYCDWLERFKPRTNHLEDNASIDGYLFQPYGEQWDFVKSHDNEYIWTLIITDTDDGGTHWEISTGMHVINREGYIVTKVPYLIDAVIAY
jgi:hypothetical protein